MGQLAVHADLREPTRQLFISHERSLPEAPSRRVTQIGLPRTPVHGCGLRRSTQHLGLVMYLLCR